MKRCRRIDKNESPGVVSRRVYIGKQVSAIERAPLRPLLPYGPLTESIERGENARDVPMREQKILRGSYTRWNDSISYNFQLLHSFLRTQSVLLSISLDESNINLSRKLACKIKAEIRNNRKINCAIKILIVNSKSTVTMKTEMFIKLEKDSMIF